ncbi:hypothetical protein Tco_0019787 [Tanacetum coccineum]
MPTEMELTLEQTQQGVSYEVSNIRVNSFTMKMEILLEPTSNKLMVDESSRPEGSPPTPGRMTKHNSSPCFTANCLLMQADFKMVIVREVFEKLLLESFGKLSISMLHGFVINWSRLCGMLHGLVNFVRILRLREVARVTARIALEFAPEFVYVYRLDFVECYLILLVMHFSVSLLLTPLCCDDIHDVTPRVSALAGMSPPIRRKYHDSVAFATGCKRIKNSKRCNRKIRIPIAMWPCRVEEKMTLKEVDGQTVEEIETKIIAKDGTITRVPGKFQGYETSEEEPAG